MLRYEYNDGGRVAAGYTDTLKRSDCFQRAASLALGKPYREVYQEVEALVKERCKTGYRGACDYSGVETDGSGTDQGTVIAYLEKHGWEYRKIENNDDPLVVFMSYLGNNNLPGMREFEAMGMFPKSGKYMVTFPAHITFVEDGVNKDTLDAIDSNMPVTGLFATPEQWAVLEAADKVK